VTTTPSPARAARRPGRRPAFVGLIVALLFGVPWWALVVAPGWPVAVVVAGSVVAFAAAVALPVLMVFGHGRRQRDAAARTGDTLLGVIWVLFAWSVLGLVAGLVVGARSAAVAVLVVAVVLVAYGVVEARRVPRVREVSIDGLGLDGLRVAVLTDTHFGPIDRSRWSARVVEVVNGLRPDVVVHLGDLADGSVARRHHQVDPLGDVRASRGRYYILGNHEHYGGAAPWVEHMRGLGWQPLVNEHRPIGDGLVLAGIDDPTGAPDLAAALAGAEPTWPVLLLAHQPSQVAAAAAAGVALQISGHTHGGQIWPFHLIVRLDQKYLHGLSRHGDRTQLYTSRGSGFWGPPLRVFAPSEITLLVLRSN
jgi:predicted MPP superfamily phosphohydrolase